MASRSSSPFGFSGDDEPERIPESWVDHGDREPVDDDEVEVRAIQAMPGTRGKNRRGNQYKSAERAALRRVRVLYVTPDASRAIEWEFAATTTSTGNLRPSDPLTVVQGAKDSLLEDVEPVNRARFKRDLGALYGGDTDA